MTADSIKCGSQSVRSAAIDNRPVGIPTRYYIFMIALLTLATFPETTLLSTVSVAPIYDSRPAHSGHSRMLYLLLAIV